MQKVKEYSYPILISWYGGTGRRKGLKIPRIFIHVGSIPTTSTIEVWLSLVEHLVWDQGVAGSNPVTSTGVKVETNVCPITKYYFVVPPTAKCFDLAVPRVLYYNMASG